MGGDEYGLKLRTKMKYKKLTAKIITIKLRFVLIKEEMIMTLSKPLSLVVQM